MKWESNLRVAVDSGLEVLVAECEIPTLSSIEHVSHLLCPFLERQLEVEGRLSHKRNAKSSTKTQALVSYDSRLPHSFPHHPGSVWSPRFGV